jgi:hypothetical protein
LLRASPAPNPASTNVKKAVISTAMNKAINEYAMIGLTKARVFSTQIDPLIWLSMLVDTFDFTNTGVDSGLIEGYFSLSFEKG